jgi:hypothetical protein
MLISEVIKGEAFKNAVNLQGIEKSLVDDMIKNLIKPLYKETFEKLKDVSSLTDSQRQQLLAQQEFLSATWLENTIELHQKEIKGSLVDLSKLQSQQAVNEINKAVKIPLVSVSAPPKFFETLVDTTLIEGLPLFTKDKKDGSPSWWNKLGNDTQRRVGQEIRKGLIAGETPQQMQNRILGKRDKSGQYQGGVLSATRREAEAITRTAVHAVTNETRKRIYETNQDILEGVQSLATLDGRTTLLCRSFDGLKWSLPDYKPIGHNKGYLAPPRHFRCRSVLVPIPVGIDEIDKKAKEMGLEITPEVRAANKGPVASSAQFDTGKDMESWFSKQTPEAQNEMLGAGRAQIWRDGKASLYQMVNQQGKTLTLAELREQVQTNSLTPLPKSIAKTKKFAEDLQQEAIFEKQKQIAKEKAAKAKGQPKPAVDPEATERAKAARAAVREAQALPSTKPVTPNKTGKGDPFTEKETLDGTGWKWVSGQQGSNEGGVYEDKQGNKYYIKFMHAGRIDAEIAASTVYEKLGLRTLNPTRVNVDGRLGIVTRWDDSLEDFKRDPDRLRQRVAANKSSFMRMYHASVLTKNWDFVGLDYDNLKFDRLTGEFVIVDTGGSFNYRAQGDKKSWSSTDMISEYSTFRGARNPQSKKIIDDAVTDNVWDELFGVDKYYQLSRKDFKEALQKSKMSEALIEQTADTLESRRLQIAERFSLSPAFNEALKKGQSLSQALETDPYLYAALQSVKTSQVKIKGVTPTKSLDPVQKWSGRTNPRREETFDKGNVESHIRELKAINNNLPKELRFEASEIRRVHRLVYDAIFQFADDDSSSAGGALIKDWAKRNIGAEIKYHSTGRTYLGKAADAEVTRHRLEFLERWRWDNDEIWKKYVDPQEARDWAKDPKKVKKAEELVDRAFALLRANDQMKLRQVHGFNYVNVERGMSYDEFNSYWNDKDFTYHPNAASSTSTARKAFLGKERISMKAKVTDVVFSSHLGREYFPHFNEDEYILNGIKYKAKQLRHVRGDEVYGGYSEGIDWNLENLE